MNKDKIYLIQLMRQCSFGYQTRHNLIFLKTLGYECNLELCSKYITIYINKFKNKLIVDFDSVDRNFMKNLNSFNMKPVIEEFMDYKKNVISIFEEINKTYNDYNKLYIGNCLGGYMINNYVNGNNIEVYTYNSFGMIHNNIDTNIKIKNYAQLLDIVPILILNHKNTVIINSFTLMDILSPIILNKKFNPHTINGIDKKTIEIYF